MIEDQRYIVCRNETEAEKDRKDREAIVAALDAQLRKGDKALVGNWPRFKIDAGQARRGGSLRWRLCVAHNAKITPLQAVLRYRNLLKVENLFLRTKAVMRTRPRLLFFLGADYAEIPGRPVMPGRRHPGMEDPSARPRSPAACAHPASRQR